MIVLGHRSFFAKGTSAVNAIVNVSIERNVGFAAVAARAVGGASLRGLPLPLHLHLLPYPGSGPAGHALAMEVKVV